MDHFFEAELPNLCGVLDIDIRSIYGLHLFGDGGGLYDLRVYISFEEPPADEQIDQLRLVVAERSSPRPAFMGGATKGNRSTTIRWLPLNVSGPPSAREWSNVHFLLGEALRDKFDPGKIVKLEFRGIPETEEEYDVRCEILCKSPVRLFPVRHALKGLKATKKKKTKPQEVIIFKPENRRGTRHGLSEHDEMLLEKYMALPHSERFRIWQKHIASYFK